MSRKREKKAVIGTCRLCLQERKLVEGHFLPGFVYRWLKAMRSPEDPNLRLQDGPQHYLMCEDCDGRVIGALEARFKRAVFDPLHGSGSAQEAIHADEAIHRFAVAQSWRALLQFEWLGGYDRVPPEYVGPLRATEEVWRTFVRGEHDDLGDRVQHFLPVGGALATGHKSPYLHRYLWRAVHTHVLFGDEEDPEEIWAYSKLGGIVLLGVVSPGDGSRAMRGTLLLPGSTVGEPGREYGIPQFLFRYWDEEADKAIEMMATMSPTQKSKIDDVIRKKRPEEILASPTTEARILDFLSTLARQIKGRAGIERGAEGSKEEE